MKVNIIIDEDELYPFYNFETMKDQESVPKYMKAAQISQETHDRWKRIMNEFWEIQKEMKAMYRST